jgi:Arc/MetJ-type ribon-helix-helix transcriptional regulator
MENTEMSQGTKERLTVRLTKRDQNGLQKLVDDGFFNSQSEAIRTAIRQLIAKYGEKEE